MKITKSRLQQIIKEEIQKVLVLQEAVTKGSARRAINKARRTLKDPTWRKLRRLAYKDPEAAMKGLQTALASTGAGEVPSEEITFEPMQITGRVPSFSKDKPFGSFGDVDPDMASLGRKKATPVERLPVPGEEEVVAGTSTKSMADATKDKKAQLRQIAQRKKDKKTKTVGSP